MEEHNLVSGTMRHPLSPWDIPLRGLDGEPCERRPRADSEKQESIVLVDTDLPSSISTELRTAFWVFTLAVPEAYALQKFGVLNIHLSPTRVPLMPYRVCITANHGR